MFQVSRLIAVVMAAWLAQAAAPQQPPRFRTETNLVVGEIWNWRAQRVTLK